MPSKSILAAAELVKASYHDGQPGVRTTFRGAGVLARLMTDGTLLVPGTNGPGDWFQFNLPTRRTSGAKMGFPATGPVGKGTWYWGFLSFAALLRRALGNTRPSYIVGHSLGAAAGQILALHYAVPCLAFAPPKSCVTPERLAGEDRILSLVYPTDIVTRYPLGVREARRPGRDYLITPAAAAGFVHPMPTYIKHLRPDLAAGRLAAAWPAGATSSRRG